MIPAPRVPADDTTEPRAFAAPSMLAYSGTVDPGCNHPGPAFRTYRATISARPATVPDATPAGAS